ncbi:competence/damage-inducible protein A [Acidithiobacillus ferridurans]|uniref:competence/damage-inducible protein A n=1 Tax=Acidithiobacillus ferridurans TaxID=1232575 RepID=UPI001C07E72A|nr:molybdopterin-binding protein [Acidithiobacillus ferridurans]MBU2731392.1 competence/damage-inducible protein A [Acidithiobacillus ferridurans]
MSKDVGLVIIGTEILSGKREDRHVVRSRQQLARRGYGIAWCLIIPDIRNILLSQLRWAMAQSLPFFSFGGLGATPDDLTRDCAAAAADVALSRHPEAEEWIRRQYGEMAEPVRIRMADLPAGAKLIPNPVNNVPGFSVGNGHFFPGFPQMAEPMSDWVLEQYFPPIVADVEARILLPHAREGDLVPLMEGFCVAHPEVRFSSLPSFKTDGPQIELGVAGRENDVQVATYDLKARLERMGLEVRDLGLPEP